MLFPRPLLAQGSSAMTHIGSLLFLFTQPILLFFGFF